MCVCVCVCVCVFQMINTSYSYSKAPRAVGRCMSISLDSYYHHVESTSPVPRMVGMYEEDVSGAQDRRSLLLRTCSVPETVHLHQASMSSAQDSRTSWRMCFQY